MTSGKKKLQVLPKKNIGKKTKLCQLERAILEIQSFVEKAKDSINGQCFRCGRLVPLLDISWAECDNILAQVKTAKHKRGGRVRFMSVSRLIDQLSEVRQITDDHCEPDALPAASEELIWIDEQARILGNHLNRKLATILPVIVRN